MYDLLTSKRAINFFL